MKLFFKRYIFTVSIVFSIALFALVTRYFYDDRIMFLNEDIEIICYGIWCITSAELFYIVAAKLRSVRTEILSCTLYSLLFTVIVFLVNNFWRYLNQNSRFEWENPIPYKYYLKWDFLYKNGYGEFRYPVVFSIMFVVCTIVIIITHPKVRKWYQNQIANLENRFYARSIVNKSVEEAYCESLQISGLDILKEYLENITVSEEKKNELMCCIDRYEEPLLIRILFRRFGFLLNKEEYTKYRKLYIEIMETFYEENRNYFNNIEVELPEVCETLDKQFDVT